MTKTYKFKKNICFLFSMMCSFGPLLVFSIMGFVQAEGVHKLSLSLTLICAIIIAAISALKKIHLRSTIYIVMIGLWMALDRLLPFILTIAVCTIFDELVFTPLYKRYKEDYHTNLQLDRRLNNGTNNVRQ